jgi:hypothetical protein
MKKWIELTSDTGVAYMIDVNSIVRFCAYDGYSDQYTNIVFSDGGSVVAKIDRGTLVDMILELTANV